MITQALFSHEEIHWNLNISSIKGGYHLILAFLTHISSENELPLELSIENFLLKNRPVGIKFNLKFFHEFCLIANLFVVNQRKSYLLARIDLENKFNNVYQQIK